MRTSRYLYTEWNGDTNPLLARAGALRHLRRPVPAQQPRQRPRLLPTSCSSSAIELDQLIDCAGADCRGAPTGTLGFTTGGGGKNGCVAAAGDARFTSPQEGDIVSVSFRAGRVAVGDDTVPPFEVAIPDSALRDELPGAANVTAKALFDDGRRLGQSANLRVCK